MKKVHAVLDPNVCAPQIKTSEVPKTDPSCHAEDESFWMSASCTRDCEARIPGIPRGIHAETLVVDNSLSLHPLRALVTSRLQKLKLLN